MKNVRVFFLSLLLVLVATFSFTSLACGMQSNQPSIEFIMDIPDIGTYSSSGVDIVQADKTGVPLAQLAARCADKLALIAKSEGIDLAGSYNVTDIRRDSGLYCADAVNFLFLRCGLESGIKVVKWKDGLTAIVVKITTDRRKKQWLSAVKKHPTQLVPVHVEYGKVRPQDFVRFLCFPELSDESTLPESFQARCASLKDFEISLPEGLFKGTDPVLVLRESGESDRQPTDPARLNFFLCKIGNHQTDSALVPFHPEDAAGTFNSIPPFLKWAFVLFLPVLSFLAAMGLSYFVMKESDFLRVWYVIKDLFTKKHFKLVLYIGLLTGPPISWGLLGVWGADVGLHAAMKAALRFVGGALCLWFFVLLWCVFLVIRKHVRGERTISKMLNVLVVSRLFCSQIFLAGFFLSAALLLFFLGFSLAGVHFTNVIGVGLYPIYAIAIAFVISLIRRVLTIFVSGETRWNVTFSQREPVNRWDSAGILCLLIMTFSFLYTATGRMFPTENWVGSACAVVYGLIYVLRNQLSVKRTLPSLSEQENQSYKGEKIFLGVADTGAMFTWAAIMLFFWIPLSQLLLAPHDPRLAVWVHEFWRELPSLLDLEALSAVGFWGGWIGMVFIASAAAYLIYGAVSVWHDEEARRLRVTCKGKDWNNVLGGLEPFVAVGVSFFLLNEYLYSPWGLVGVCLGLGGFLWFRLCKLADDVFIGKQNELITERQKLWLATKMSSDMGVSKGGSVDI